ncbi:hypothetical protein [Streptobacillus canis]|uniref:hypothetical protein n=1 Tax=Streptobacillus canis TaxID=2678686 RepID=UPI0012E1E741|nr:hypothetical protein [Streptobacillus canis]
MKKRIILLIAIMINIISFSEVMRVTFIEKNSEIERFSTENEEFSDEFDLIVPEIRTKDDGKPKLVIRFLQKEKINNFNKIEIVNDKEEIKYNFTDNDIKITFTDEDKVARFVEKEIALNDIQKLFEMSLEKEKIRIKFINEKNDIILKEISDIEKEILKITLLNYIYKLNNINGTL